MGDSRAGGSKFQKNKRTCFQCIWRQYVTPDRNAIQEQSWWGNIVWPMPWNLHTRSKVLGYFSTAPPPSLPLFYYNLGGRFQLQLFFSPREHILERKRSYFVYHVHRIIDAKWQKKRSIIAKIRLPLSLSFSSLHYNRHSSIGEDEIVISGY